GDSITFSGATTVGGLNLNGTFLVDTVVTLNQFTFPAGSAAGSNATGGGVVTFTYEINVGSETGAYGQGWGVGQWGLNTWGTPRNSSVIFIEPRVWAL